MQQDATAKTAEMLRDEAAWHQRRLQAYESLYLPRKPAREVAENDLPALYDVAAGVIGNVPLLYLEFGVFQGRSIGRMAERFPHPGARFVGFDSFEGLPEDWVLPWHTTPRGTFSTAHETPAVADGRISFVKGWFQNTLPDFLARGEAAYRAPVLVHYDADLYSSTQFILSLLWGHVPDYYFVFDEFMEHELVALYDFSRAFTVEIEFVAQTNVGGHPAQTFGHIRRIPFTLPSAA